jgi:hypothetical protein
MAAFLVSAILHGFFQGLIDPYIQTHMPRPIITDPFHLTGITLFNDDAIYTQTRIWRLAGKKSTSGK